MLETQPRNGSFPVPTSTARSILIVEDDRAVGTILELVLNVAGHQVRVVQDFGSALHAINGARFDLILLDLQLPDGDGLDLLQHLRNELEATTPVIILSATRAEENRPRGFELGANDYLTKPFSSEDLIERVRLWTEAESSLK